MGFQSQIKALWPNLLGLKMLLLAVIAPLIIFSARSWADEKPRVRCIELLTEVQNILNVDKKARADLKETIDGVSSLPTVKFKRERTGRHGGKLLIFEKVGKLWVSDHRTVGYDPQGDPRSFITVLGERAAEFFGFKMISENLIQVPDAAEFMGAVEKINAYLKSKNIPPIALTYYSTNDNENVKVAHYIKMFMDHLGIPLAQSGNHLLHDLDFHTGGIFIPSELLELKTETNHYMEKFISFLTQKFSQDSVQAKAIRYFSYVWRMRETTNIDNATGLPTIGLLLYMHKPSYENTVLFDNITELLTNDGRSPKALLEKFIKDLNNFISYIQELGFSPLGTYGFAKLHKSEEHLKAVSIVTLLASLEEFDVANPLPADLLAKFEAAKSPSVKDKYCEEMTARRLIIRDAALALFAELPPEPKGFWRGLLGKFGF